MGQDKLHNFLRMLVSMTNRKSPTTGLTYAQLQPPHHPKSFTISPLSLLPWSSLHTGLAVISARGFIGAGWVSSSPAYLFPFNPFSCLLISSSVINKPPMTCDDESIAKAEGTNLQILLECSASAFNLLWSFVMVCPTAFNRPALTVS